MKLLEKDRTRRYEDGERPGFARDIQRTWMTRSSRRRPSQSRRTEVGKLVHGTELRSLPVTK